MTAEPKRIVVVGAGGRLGAALVRAYADRYSVAGLTHGQVDLGDYDEVEHILSPMAFDVLINCAAMTNVDMCEEQPDEASRVNAGGPGVLAEICDTKNARLIHFSTDYVFDGQKREPYLEGDNTEPISVYGESKREGEEAVLDVSDKHVVVRVSWVFGPDRSSFVDNIIQRARENDSVAAIADKFSTPTYTQDIAEMLPRFFESDTEGGIWHFANAGQCTWQEYAQHALDCCLEAGVPLRTAHVDGMRLADMKSWAAQRPVYSVLSTNKYAMLAGEAPRSWREAVAEYVQNSVTR